MCSKPSGGWQICDLDNAYRRRERLDEVAAFHAEQGA
jgi:hypothetical protein